MIGALLILMFMICDLTNIFGFATQMYPISTLKAHSGQTQLLTSRSSLKTTKNAFSFKKLLSFSRYLIFCRLFDYD